MLKKTVIEKYGYLRVFAALLVLLVVAASLEEAGRSRWPSLRPSAPLRALRCFSAPSNCRRLVSTRVAASQLGCLHGIRFLSASWIVMAHTWIQEQAAQDLAPSNTIQVFPSDLVLFLPLRLS